MQKIIHKTEKKHFIQNLNTDINFFKNLAEVYTQVSLSIFIQERLVMPSPSLYYLNGFVPDRIYIWIVAFSCLLRPTSCILWLPLCLYDIGRSPSPCRRIMYDFLPVG